MIVIQYTANGTAYGDHEVKNLLCSLDKSLNHLIKSSTSNLITMSRVLIKQKIIHHDRICYKYDNFILFPDQNGRLETWPDGFCDFDEKCFMELF